MRSSGGTISPCRSSEAQTSSDVNILGISYTHCKSHSNLQGHLKTRRTQMAAASPGTEAPVGWALREGLLG